MSLPHLPTELQNLIIVNLHPTAAIALSKTNHHYHSTVSLHRLDPDTVRRFLAGLELRSANEIEDVMSRQKLACYKCLCLKSVWSFEISELKGWVWVWDKVRQCLECGLQDGRVKPGGIYSSCYHKPIIVCIECLKAQGEFCRGCGACAPCLERKGVESCVDCGWCDACVGHKLVEWESREKERDEEDEGEGFFMPETCRHHVPGYWKELDMKRELEEGENEEGNAGQEQAHDDGTCIDAGDLFEN